MKAIICASGTPTLHERPEPETGPFTVGVRTHAMALNNGDLSSDGDGIAGFEFSGIVEVIGDGVPDSLLGKRVMGIGEGAFAEFVVTDYRHVLAIPDGIDFPEAAALPVALSTEYGALRRAGAQRGDTVLITAATSGIALIGLQVARALGASMVIGTTRTGDRADLLRRAGADEVIVLEDGVDLADRMRRLTDGEGADVVLDHVSGTGLGAAIDAARKGGVVVSVGRITGPTAEIDLFRLARQQVVLHSVSYGLTPPEVIGDLLEGVAKDLAADVAAGRIHAVIDSQHSFDEASAAFDRLAAGRAEGKVVLTLG